MIRDWVNLYHMYLFWLILQAKSFVFCFVLKRMLQKMFLSRIPNCFGPAFLQTVWLFHSLPRGAGPGTPRFPCCIRIQYKIEPEGQPVCINDFYKKVKNGAYSSFPKVPCNVSVVASIQDDKAIIALPEGKGKRKEREFRICFLFFCFLIKTWKNANFTHLNSQKVQICHL